MMGVSAKALAQNVLGISQDGEEHLILPLLRVLNWTFIPNEICNLSSELNSDISSRRENFGWILCVSAM